MLNFMICDDNPHIVESTSKFLESIFIKHDIDANIALRSCNYDEIIDYARNNTIHVALMDVELNSNKTGIDIAKELRKINKNVYFIFFSAHMQYVFDSLKARIFDYLLKPITYEKLEDCIIRLSNDIKKSKYIRFNHKIAVNRDDILMIEKKGLKCIVHLLDTDLAIRLTLDEAHHKLSEEFIRCHKSYIANQNKIQSINYLENKLVLENNIYCPIGPKYKINLGGEFNNAGLVSDIVC